jgi:hypothetical protein
VSIWLGVGAVIALVLIAVVVVGGRRLVAQGLAAVR